ncbi:OmpA family protein [Limnohabitans sp. 63ED37-2]|uniref:OmpA family protein n=1 Tax=Limnohabitans sp. 63ED37-2 TaxID=1678128 RepID=UPI0007068993|nr:OmpA family protein [Limnohabitans sp. 63ED37-2]ALK88684.1 Outer membrane protein A precursor [Limnohabitans sp. 63ED37-2]
MKVLAQRVTRTVLTVYVLVAAANSALAQSSDSRVNIDAFGELFTTALAAPANQTRVFVFRNNQAPNSKPVNIYLNGQYHASLLRGGFSEFCAAPGFVNIKAALDDASRLHTSKLDAGQRLELKAGQTIFLKVDESTSPAIGLLSGTAAQAKADIEGTRRQIHTISRAKAALTCGQPAAVAAVAPPAAPKPPVPREYALETDALFEFGKAEIRASGYNAIESLVQRLLQDFSSVERIRVVGYTDPIGSAAFNKKLSQQRADVVARQIASRNIPIERGIEAEGRGSIELVKTGCGNSPTPENKLCHAPNRRVMVVITGARR